MNRNVSTRVLAARPARFQPKKKSIVGRLLRWTVFLGVLGAVAASFFVHASDDQTYADLTTIPASKWVYTFVKDKISPPEEDAEAPAKPPAPSELDRKFDAAVAARRKAEAATDETVDVLTRELDASSRRIDVVREVGVAASKPAPRKTRVAAAQAVEELAAEAAVQKKLAATLTRVTSELDVKAALAAVPPPPPPPAPAPAPPAVVFYDLRKLYAWPAQPVGTWVRWKKGAGETEDQVLAALTDEAAVVRVESPTPAERVYVFSGRVVREESFKVGDAEIPCRVVQSGSTLRWIPKEGPAADRVAIKVQTGDQVSVVTELTEEEIPVRGEPKKCLRYTIGDVTTWGHDDVPGFAVRIGSAEVVDWGADAATRPAIVKKPAAEEPSEKAALAEAGRLKVEGWVLLERVIVELRDKPEDPETLKALYVKLETATALLTKSKESFLAARKMAADPTTIDETISILDRVLEIADRRTESIRYKLKSTP